MLNRLSNISYEVRYKPSASLVSSDNIVRLFMLDPNIDNKNKMRGGYHCIIETETLLWWRCVNWDEMNENRMVMHLKQ